ncbi:MAG TPA: phenylacetate--CoA ligase family protein, partial [Deltaproteobacteria bacterium]|nr:phenylacetate--CoA ligase family protein [Deltaproteobacteria bacterium]
DAELVKRIKSGVKKQIMVSVDVELLKYGSLPRSERKSKRVFDNREE